MIPLNELPLTTPTNLTHTNTDLHTMRRRFLAVIVLFSGLTGCPGLGYKYDCGDYDYTYEAVEEYYLQDPGDTCPDITDRSGFDGNRYDYNNCDDAVLTEQQERNNDTVCSYALSCPEFETIGWLIYPSGTDCPETLPPDDEAMITYREEYSDYSDYDYYDGTCSSIELVEKNGTICTYEMECEAWSCCGYGRPYLDHEAKPVTTEVSSDPAWQTPVAVSVEALTEAERARLASFWLKNAKAEHSSVAGFHRFALDLLAHGAPPELLLEAQRAASQEVQHAIDCFSLASRYAGEVRGPAPMPMGESAPIAQSLAELAAWTVRDGAVGETIAAYLAAQARERATDPVVRDKLAVIARDETEHAELAWKTLAWALSAGGDAVRQAIMACVNSIDPEDVAEEWTSPGLVAHGLLPAAEQTAAIRRCIDEVIRPVAASLLARDLAA